MTETSDIAALREFLECEIIPNEIMRNFANKVINQLEAERQRAENLDISETQVIAERDAAEEALSDMYEAATGQRPEWSNMFQFADAVEKVGAVRQQADDAERANRNQYRDLTAGHEVQKGLRAEIAELKAKLANPVELHNERFDYQDPDEYEQGYVRGYNASRLNSIADIEKSGFTVKGA
ncbi:hypothetical protein [Rahnella sp. BCC 1045]|uniref:hypothetical protein n=1 Tax=Rahnella sp. BCC 1045 TaxID=2816251 RepID=UPI0035302713